MPISFISGSKKSLNIKSLEQICSRNISLSGHSSYEIGGEANYFALPETIEETILLLNICKKSGIPYSFFGLGANILFPDKPQKDKIFISLKKCIELELNEGRLFLSAGIPITFLSIISLTAESGRFAFSYLLPGSLGAGIYINAKYGGTQICDIIDSVYYVDTKQDSLIIQKIKTADCGFDYKKSIFQNSDFLILGTDILIPGIDGDKMQLIQNSFIKLKEKTEMFSSLKIFYKLFSIDRDLLLQNPGKISGEYLEIEQYRLEKKHFEYPSCGSVFKNNYNFGKPMGKVIEDLGLKGKSHGGAMISPHHGNMILNMNHASASDVLYLIQIIKDAVYKAHNFIPELEVVIMKE